MAWYSEGLEIIIEEINRVGALLVIIAGFWIVSEAVKWVVPADSFAYKIVDFLEQVGLVAMFILLLIQSLGGRIQKVYRQLFGNDNDKRSIIFGTI